MDPVRAFGRSLLVFGLAIAAVGVFVLVAAKLPFRLGRLTGDISYHRRHASFYFPMVTCIVLSAVLTLVFWIIGMWRR